MELQTEEIHICRICLRLIDEDINYIHLDQNPTHKTEFDQVFPDFTPVQNSAICEKCLIGIQTCFNLKQTTSSTELNSKSKLSEDMCRICLKPAKPYMPLNNNGLIKTNLTELRDIIETCLGKLDLRSSKDPFICETCWLNLDMSYAFICNSKVSEARIASYALSKKLNVLSSQDLINITFGEVEVDFNLKNEPLQIKEEGFDLQETGDGDKFECSQCSFSTTIKRYFRSHLVTYNHYFNKTEEERSFVYRCKSCNYETKELMWLKQHLMQNKEHRMDGEFKEMEKGHKCEHCGFATIWKSALKKHLLTHKAAEERPKYKCEICQVEYLTKHQLNIHKVKHQESATTYKCHHCDYSTLVKRHLSSHVVVHLNLEKSFSCEFCNFRTSRKGSLDIHRAKHTKKGEFKCEQCSYSTFSKMLLGRHCLLHKNKEELKQFSCSFCLYKTIRKSNLNQHMLSHANEKDVKTYCCAPCNYQTKWRHCYKNHLKRHGESVGDKID